MQVFCDQSNVSSMKARDQEVPLCQGRVGITEGQAITHLYIHSFTHSRIHTTNVYSVPAKCQVDWYDWLSCAEGNPGFRKMKGSN